MSYKRDAEVLRNSAPSGARAAGRIFDASSS